MRRLCYVISAGIILALALNLTADTEGQATLQPSGTWVWSTYTPVGAALPALVTFHQDGTVAGTDFSMFGGTASSLSRRTTPFHGVWERTGPSTVGVTSLYLVYDALAGRL